MLLACNAPVASGLYRAKQKTGFHYAAWVKNPRGEGYFPIQGWTAGSNWIKVDAIGLGFCLLKREVFERIPHPWFKWDKPAPSEDFYFCEQLIKYGYEIRVLTDVKCSHIGTLKVHHDGTISTLEV
jgi:GT2 family glycosyltransferase